MIPLAQIIQWRQTAPWTDDMQVEQDLILSRAIVEIFSNPFLAFQLAFRGGTALHKLFFSPAARYSEDIDLVRQSSLECLRMPKGAIQKQWIVMSNPFMSLNSILSSLTLKSSKNCNLRNGVEG